MDDIDNELFYWYEDWSVLVTNVPHASQVMVFV